MAGITVSFIADPKLAARVREIARSDGVTQSQAAARASALGAMLSPAARRALRFVLEEGGEADHKQLAAVLARAIAQVGNSILERQLLEHGRNAGLSEPDGGEDADFQDAVEAVHAYRREQADVPAEPAPGGGSKAPGGVGD